MKLVDLLQEAATPTGSYAAVKFDQATQDAIAKYLSDNDIPNAVTPTKLHATLLYSHKYLPKYQPHGDIDPPWKGTPTGFDVWESQPTDDGSTKRCLVLEFKCKQLSDRHEFLMDKHEAQYDFDEYKPHVTFSYDIGKLDVSQFPSIVDALPELTIVSEYGEDLKDDFADSSTDE